MKCPDNEVELKTVQIEEKARYNERLFTFSWG